MNASVIEDALELLENIRADVLDDYDYSTDCGPSSRPQMAGYLIDIETTIGRLQGWLRHAAGERGMPG